MNVIMLIAMLLCFFVLYVAYPYFCFGYLWKEKDGFSRIFYALAAGCTIVIIIVYVLFFLKIYNRYTLIGSLLVVAVLSQILGGQRRRAEITNSISKKYILIKNGEFRIKTLLINLRMRYFVKNDQLERGIFWRLLFLLLTAICIGYGLYVRLYPTIGVSFLGISDLYTHLDWLRDMQDGVIFKNGIYPYGYHNIIFAFQTLFPFSLVSVVQMWGGITFILILFSFIFLTLRLFKSPAARLAVIWAFCVSDIFVYFRYTDYRLGFGLPQEFALIFVFPAILFFVDYLREHKTSALIGSALCLGLTALINYYVMIFLLLAFLVLIAVNLPNVLKRSVLFSALFFYAMMMIIAALPIVTGLISGKQFEQSLNWAVDASQASPENTVSDKDFLDNFDSKSKTAQNSFAKAYFLATEEFRRFLFPDREVVTGSMRTDINLGYLLPNGMNKYSVPFLLCLLSACALLILKSKKSAMYKLQLWYVLFCVFLFVLAIAYQLGFPQVLILQRQRIFLRFMILPIFGFLPELLEQLYYACKKRRLMFIPQALLIAIFLLIGFDSIFLKHVALRMPSVQNEYSQTAETLSLIKAKFARQTYTVLATVHELPIVRNDGYHYDLADFLKILDGSRPVKRLEIPTKYVFVFAEKMVLPMSRIVDPHFPQTLQGGKAISAEAAQLQLPNDKNLTQNSHSDLFYNNPENRNIIMSKIYQWANGYLEYYPDEMTVYYEDDELVVYQLKQDIFALNDLYFDYRGSEELF